MVAAACALTVLPTMITNARRGAFVVADAARFNLWVGLNDRSPRNLVGEIVGDEYRAWQASAPTFRERERILDARIAALVAQRGPIAIARAQLGRQYFRPFHHDSFFTDQLPGGAIASQGLRVPRPAAASWPRPPRVVQRRVAGGAGGRGGPGRAAPRAHRMAGGAAGLRRVQPRRSSFLLHVKTRYRIPFLPVLTAGGRGVAALLGELRLGLDPARAGRSRERAPRAPAFA